jgi:hypothetical protein
MEPMNATLTFAETFTAEDAAAHWRTLQITIGGGARHVEQMLLRTVRPWLIRAQAAGMVADWSMLRPPWDPAGSAMAELRINLRCADRTQAADLRYQIEATHRGEPGVMVVERAFSPAVERFGGPYGMAVCMTHLSQASKISAATIQATTPGAQRLHATPPVRCCWRPPVRCAGTSAGRSTGCKAMPDHKARSATGHG